MLRLNKCLVVMITGVTLCLLYVTVKNISNTICVPGPSQPVQRSLSSSSASDQKTSSLPAALLDINLLERTVPLNPCPQPYNGTECAVMMQGSKGLQNTHMGFISIDNRKALEWTRTTGIFLVQLSQAHACTVQETVHFDENNMADFAGYVGELARDTLLLGVSGDFHFLHNPYVTRMLGVLGIQLHEFKEDTMLAFHATAGFPGLAEWRTQSKNNGPLVFSTTITQGRLYNLHLYEQTYQEIGEAYPTVEEGGHWKPRHCKPLWNIAIIIPFRDRESHLRALLSNLIGFLQQQNLEFTIYVVEQEGSSVFNKDWLMNIGYVQAKQRSNYDCYIFHDVDLMPEDLANQYACSDQPRHLAVTMSKFSYKIPYVDFIGGAVSLTSSHMEQINGFSNVMYGYGGEDDEIFGRIAKKRLPLLRYPANIGRYFMIVHKRDQKNPVSNRGFSASVRHSRFMEVDGLNSLTYEHLSVATKALYTHITAFMQGPSTGDDIPAYYQKATSFFETLLKKKYDEYIGNQDLSLDKIQTLVHLEKDKQDVSGISGDD